MCLKPAHSRCNEQRNLGSSISCSIVLWNLSGNLLNQPLFLKDFLSKCDIMCIQEHFTTTLSLSLLELPTNHKVFLVAAQCSQSRGQPCSCLATFVKSCFPLSIFYSASDFLAIRIQIFLC